MLNSNETNKSLCPCCGKAYSGEYDICSVCGWENDPNQSWNPNLSGGANEMSLNQAREAYKSGQPVQ